MSFRVLYPAMRWPEGREIEVASMGNHGKAEFCDRFEEVTEEGGNPHATLVGFGQKTSVRQAALVNGSASHALDYDDVVEALRGHPTVPVYSPLLALAEKRRASGEALLAAFVAGFETECRVGDYMGDTHYESGWHATGTSGVFGAAAACANLLGLAF